MCGIAGIHRFADRPIDRSSLAAMAASLDHRGPDARGFWQSPRVGLAHTRLSIIDLGGSDQPMLSADQRWVLCFNGEIYNYRQLRSALAYPFRTSGDTEVILAGISIEGLSFISKLVGQFAFALHDTDTGTTHLVRDRLGVLPLYYAVDDECLVFGSEVKAVFASGEVDREVDFASLDSYLTARSVAAPDTLFERIKKLPAAHRAEVGRDGSMTVLRYWQPPEEDPAGTWTPESAIAAVDAAVTEAVESALVADVPVGAYLSGGVDSSLIVAAVARLRPEHRVQTFAAGFGDARTDEVVWARRVSDHLRTDHHEVTVAADDFCDLWPTLTWHRDAPLSEPADIAVYRLAQSARQHVRVILSGEGGDELFAGYPKYRAARAVAFTDMVPRPVRAAVADFLDPRMPARLAKVRIALRAAAAPSRDERYRTWFAPFTNGERSTLLAGTPTRVAASAKLDRGEPIRQMLLADLRSWLPDNLLERGDRMSMAASLELRPPLLDHRLVDLAFKLPSSVKVRGGTTKWVLKEVARSYLPFDVIDRRKVGFRVPLATWFRGGLRDSMWDHLTGVDSFVAQTFDRKTVAELLSRHEKGGFNEESRIWTLMSLEIWHRTFFGTARVG